MGYSTTHYDLKAARLYIRAHSMKATEWTRVHPGGLKKLAIFSEFGRSENIRPNFRPCRP